MTLYIEYNPSDGSITNWYDSAYYTPPSGTNVLAITPAQFAEIQAQQGYTVQGGVLTAPTAAQLLALAKNQQLAYLRQACDQNIQAGFPSSIGVVTLKQSGSSHDQTNALMAALTAQGAMAQAKNWAALQTVPPSHVITDGKGDFWTTFTGGVTGASLPTLPTTFSTPAIDGTVTWFRLGFRIGTTAGTVIVDPLTVVSLFAQGTIFVNNMRAQYEQLKIQVNAATTISAVQSITWTNP